MTLNSDNVNSPSHVVGIGASAGGLEAIEAFFKNMQAHSGLSFVVVQHLSPDYKSLMAELLSKHTQMPVKRIEEGMVVEANQVYLIPPKHNLTIFHGKLLLTEQVRNEGLNLPVDIFLKSLAEDYQERAIAVILSGTGSDGTRGIRAIKEHGGMVVAQDEHSARFSGMPKNVIATGLADFILPPTHMPAELLSFIEHPYSAPHEPAALTDTGTTALTRIFAMLREHAKLDFTYYKPNTVTRRIERRITVNQLPDLDAYIRFLEQNPQELTVLYQELLIGVTCFFRDHFVFEQMQQHGLPNIINQLHPNEEVRVWVAGCSTGEEAYSLAMLLAEYREQSGRHYRVKLFATDIDQKAVEKASAGLYPESIAADVPPELLHKYFHHKGENFQIVPQIREMVVFARHNLIKDPPFTHIHLISCRNVLIYLQPVLQKKILELFSFSLVRNSFLLLGTSESIGELTDQFESVSNKAKLFRTKGNFRRHSHEESRDALASPDFGVSRTLSGSRPFNSQQHGERMLERFLQSVCGDLVPFTLLVNEQLEVTHVFGDSREYLRFPTGKVSNDVTKIVHKALSIAIATGVNKVLKGQPQITLSNIQMKTDENLRRVTITIKRLPGKRDQSALLAIMLYDAASSTDHDSSKDYDIAQDAQQRISDLEQELQFTRENLQATVEELETSNEELQATNEELLASNEELQSTNEELQSVNEELYTVNTEYQGKINELTLSNNDLDNLFNSTRIATLFLDENLDVRRYTPPLEKIFHLRPTDIGRPFFHLSHTLLDIDLDTHLQHVGEWHKTLEQEVKTSDDHWYLLRILPYQVADHIYAGIILTFVNIDRLKMTETALKQRDQDERKRLTQLVLDAEDAITLQNSTGQIMLFNRGAEKLYGYPRRELIGEAFTKLLPDQSPPLAPELLATFQQKQHIPSFEGQRRHRNGTLFNVSISATVLFADQPGEELLALIERDLTRHTQQFKRDCVNCLQHLATLVLDTEDVLVLLDPDGHISAWNKGAEQNYGWLKNEAIGRKLLDWTPETERTALADLLEQLRSAPARSATLTTRRYRKNQPPVSVIATIQVLGDAKGEPLMLAFSERLA
ncbi:MAG: chemotaxis protein CheB [Methylococcales bacterium]|nr:chemotaxis protein CheB [Methylococcales bacterium]